PVPFDRGPRHVLLHARLSRSCLARADESRVLRGNALERGARRRADADARQIRSRDRGRPHRSDSLVAPGGTMHRYSAIAAMIALGLLTAESPARAQSAMLNLPRVSQHALVSQRIGITDVTIDYHRPLVDDRKIFGGLQAYDQVWRAGANE